MKSWPILLAVLLLAFTTSTLGNFDADTLDKDENQVKTRSVDEEQDQEHSGELYALKHKRRSMVNLMQRLKRSWFGPILSAIGSLGINIGSEKHESMHLGEVKIIAEEEEDESLEKIKPSEKKKGSYKPDDDDDNNDNIDDDDDNNDNNGNKKNKKNKKNKNSIDDDDDNNDKDDDNDIDIDVDFGDNDDD